MKKSYLFLLLLTTVSLIVTPLYGERESIRKVGWDKSAHGFAETGTWVDQASGFATASRGISYLVAVNENVAWASAYNGLSTTTYIVEYTRTTNAGLLWTASGITGYASGWGTAMIYAVNANKAWIPVFNTTAGGGRILYTSDGGTNWNIQTTAAFAAPAGFPNLIHFWDENVGFCQGDPNGGYFELYTTTDGGTNWTRVPSVNIPAPSASDEYGVVGYYSVVGNTIWFSTNKGRLFKSTDKGLNWTVTTTPIGNNQFKIKFKDQNYGIAYVPTNSTAYKTTDGGATWTTYIPNGPFYSNHYTYVPGTPNTWVSTGAATGVSGASYSFDGGTTWVDFIGTSGTQFLGVDFYDAVTGWAGGFNTSSTAGGMRKYVGNLVPVELTSFKGMQTGNNIQLEWITATEVNNFGFEIERKISSADVQSDWVVVGFKQGFGTTAEQKSYSFTDNIGDVSANAISYRLKQIDYDGKFAYSQVVEIDNILPLEYKLLQNFPNPFNPSTLIKYQLPDENFVSLKVYNLLGQEVKSLVNQVQKPGVHSVQLNASDLASGIYIALIKVGEGKFSQSIKLNLLK
ncbi:MAG: T9SS type A sorting domain-containing protein [Ignavibacteriaceae bacterium]|nr:T9SS type A sorting domain-containing protein [Ignavibacteriaceae bacterium]